MMGNKQPQPRIILFGASLTQWSFREETSGFGWTFKQRYAGKAEVVNEGKAGYTSTTLNPEFERVLQEIKAPNAPRTLFITILVGANDACIIGPNGEEYCPLSEFEENIRNWVDSILVEDKLSATKILLITPPPLDISNPPYPDKVDLEVAKAGRGYLTYLNKKRYAEKVMEIARSYEHTGFVAGADIWTALIETALEEQGRLDKPDAFDPEMLPGCGLPKAKCFGTGYFTDGLHFGKLGYEVVTRELTKVISTNWPEVLPEALK
ncbi:SGNH hydrolase-type esterase domain-containing protein [Dendryphion nanum]|uniref:SGNH hydrolase-type esterase domain-containing protein n=1 Tax=Dendryphion nanum TaxID=256645 RepID=A0A9P9DBD0_9PLEO|nr:SGNH hydrolase-type esterase domain-containing protein [Dendryphion nanum]